MSPDKQAIAEKICSVLKKLGVSEELVSLVEKDIMGTEEAEEEEVEEEGSMEPGKMQKKATVVVVKKDGGERQSMTDMLKGF